MLASRLASRLPHNRLSSVVDSASLVRSIVGARSISDDAKQCKLEQLTQAYRRFGHFRSQTNPLQADSDVQLEGQTLNMSEYVDDKLFQPTTYGLDANTTVSGTSIEERIQNLQQHYMGFIGYEFDHLLHAEERAWFVDRVEQGTTTWTAEEKRQLFAAMAESEYFDHFMQKRFQSTKRYGLEGAESMIAALYSIFRVASQEGVDEIVIAMPHRGRLNLLAGLLQFPVASLFAKVRGKNEMPPGVPGTADVLSHLATSVDIDIDGKSLHVSLLHNPSHLDAVDPVALGKVRAKQDDLDNSPNYATRKPSPSVMCVMIHGDASVNGQGVVTESLQFANLQHYSTAGTYHIIVNNQLGYTTPATQGRSSPYASDCGKVVYAPVVHVNGEEPEEVASAAAVACSYRNTFKKDVFLDILAYRRHGHNELDEPAFTQPLMYKHIRNRPTVVVALQQKLMEEGVIDTEFIDQHRDECNQRYTDAQLLSDKENPIAATAFLGKWQGGEPPVDVSQVPPTGVAIDRLREIGIASVDAAQHKIHARLDKQFVGARKKAIESGKNIDYPTAEALAVGSLLQDGFDVRLAGQDVGRGTFSHRHFVFTDQETGAQFVPFEQLPNRNGRVAVVNSPLSEFAGLGFEYGYSLENLKSLVMWEAQFGDFFNGAQIIIDTFISSGEDKWARQSGLVVSLPHGFDGAGPEHSTCRPERWIQMCDADDRDVFSAEKRTNMRIIQPSSPATIFHALRRQMVTPYRKPLIVFGPKTLLRLPAARCSLEELAEGSTFQPVLTDPNNSANASRVVLCSGKLYYDLVKARKDNKLEDDVALLRVEEIVPFPATAIQEQLAGFSNAQSVVWAQEEPRNGGAWGYMSSRLPQVLPQGASLLCQSRPPSAAPAVSVAAIHAQQSNEILEGALGISN